MEEKSSSGYFTAFDGNTGGEPGLLFGQRQANAAGGGAAGTQKTRSGPANKLKATQRAVRPKRTRQLPNTGADTQFEQKSFSGEGPDQSEELLNRPPVGSLMRTKRLIMAALRVWELKQGIRE